MAEHRPLLRDGALRHHLAKAVQLAETATDPALLEAEGGMMSALVQVLLERQRERRLFNSQLYDFYSFCQARLEGSYSQILQDLWVLFMLREKLGGYFVEFGACDGLMLSNTVLLEREYGWTGILAEPDPVWHEALNRNRKCSLDLRCVYERSGERLSFMHVPAMPELSRVTGVVPDDVHEHNGNRENHRTIDVGTVSLQELLDEHAAPTVIDYLSMDTEGSELNVLQSFDFSSYRFRLISVEHAGEFSKREGLRSLLECHGYRRWRPELSRWDDWYICPTLLGSTV